MLERTLPPALSDVQRWALQLAEAHGWGVQVEAKGQTTTLRHGQPGRALVLYLGERAAERLIEEEAPC